jgi:hypothetical protein
MNHFALLRHLVRKDAHHQRHFLFFIWLLALLWPLSNLFLAEHPLPSLVVGKMIILSLVSLLVVFSLISVMLLDPTSGSTRFLATRPIPWWLLFTSKLLFALLFLWLPLVLARLLGLVTVGFHLSLADQALHLLELSLVAAGVAALFVLPALFLRRMSTVLLTLVGCSIAAYILFVVIDENWEVWSLNNWRFQQANINVRLGGVLVAGFSLLLTALVIALLRYWKPRPAVPLTLLAGGLFYSVFFLFFSPFEPDQIFAQQNGITVDSPRDSFQKRIAFRADEPVLNFTLPAGEDSSAELVRKRREFRYEQRLVYENVQLPFFVRSDNPQHSLRISSPSGRLLPFREPSLPGSLQYNRLHDYLRRIAGVSSSVLEKETSQESKLTLQFVGHDPKRKGPDLTEAETKGATLQAHLFLQICRLKILKILPFQNGARFDLPRRSYEIRHISVQPKQIDFQMYRMVLPVILRSDFGLLAERAEDMGIVFLNKKTGEILDDDHYKTFVNPDFAATYHQYLHRQKLRGAGHNEPYPDLPPHWQDDAVVCFFTFEEMDYQEISFSSKVTKIVH